MAKAKIDWCRVVVSALAAMVNVVGKTVHQAVREALEEHGINPQEVTVLQYDDLTTAVTNLHQTLEA